MSFIFRAGGAKGAIAWGEAPQRGAQPQELSAITREAPAGVTEQRPFYLHNLPPFQGLIFFLSRYPGLRVALRRSTPGYCSISASGAYADRSTA
jgi:hypothetical protein